MVTPHRTVPHCWGTLHAMHRARLGIALIATLTAGGCAKERAAEPAAQSPSSSDKATTPAEDAAVEPRPDIEKIAIAVRANKLGRLFDTVRTMAAVWADADIDLRRQIEGTLPSTLVSPPPLEGPHFLDIAYPHPGQPSSPGDVELRAFITLDDAAARLGKTEELQPIGQGQFEYRMEDGPTIVARGEATGATFATTLPMLDQMMQVVREAPAPDGRFQLQTEVANLPADSINPGEVLDLQGLPSTQSLSTVIKELTGLRLELGVDEDETLRVRGRVSAPFERLGLSSLGPSLTSKSPLATRLPGNAAGAVLLSLSNPTPAIRQIDAIEGQLTEVPPPFDASVTTALGAIKSILQEVKGEVLVAAYLTSKQELAVVAVAKTPNQARTKQALHTLLLEAERALKSHIALVGEDPNERYSASFKPEGLGFAQGRADIFTVRLSRAMAADIPGGAAIFFGDDNRDVELLGYVGEQYSIVTLGVGGKKILADYLRRVNKPRSGDLEAAGGLARARALAEGCQLCVVVNPHESMRILQRVATLEEAGEDPTIKELLTSSALDGQIAIGAKLDDAHATAGVVVPPMITSPSPRVREVMKTLYQTQQDEVNSTGRVPD